MHVVNSTDRPIRLGRRGENLVTQVKFDIARWLGELGAGTAVLLVQRPDDAEPYMAEISQDGASVVWDVTAVDTAAAGFGSCELQYIIGERIAKSAVFMTDVAASLGDPSEDTPDPFVAWEQRVVLASVAAQEAAAQIINMQVRAVTLEPDEEAYVHTAVVEDVYQMTFGIPRGHDGQGGGGTGDHSRLSNRNLNDQHPMEAITGLVEALLAKYVKPDGGIPASDLAEAVRSSLAKAESALQTAPVASVNGKTGAVRLTPADLGIGSVFTLKGSKPSAAALPTTGNAIGDVWYVTSESVGYIWLNDGQTDRWEQLGIAVDLSAYQTKSINDAGGYFQSDTVEGALQELGGALDDIDETLGGKQDALTAGENITIVDNVISAAGGGGGEWELWDDITTEDGTLVLDLSSNGTKSLDELNATGMFVFSQSDSNTGGAATVEINGEITVPLPDFGRAGNGSIKLSLEKLGSGFHIRYFGRDTEIGFSSVATSSGSVFPTNMQKNYSFIFTPINNFNNFTSIKSVVITSNVPIRAGVHFLVYVKS